MFNKKLQKIITVVNNEPVTGNYDDNGNLVNIKSCDIVLRQGDKYARIYPHRFHGDKSVALEANPISVTYKVDIVGNIFAIAEVYFDTGNGTFVRNVEYFRESMDWLLYNYPIPQSILIESNRRKESEKIRQLEYVVILHKNNQEALLRLMPSDDELIKWVESLNKEELSELERFCLNFNGDNKVSQMINDGFVLQDHHVTSETLNRLKEILVK